VCDIMVSELKEPHLALWAWLKKLIYYYFIFFLPLGSRFWFAGNITEVPILPEEGSHQNESKIPKQGNIGEGNIWFNLNESRDNKQSKLI
jgi:hypothetical protein